MEIEIQSLQQVSGYTFRQLIKMLKIKVVVDPVFWGPATNPSVPPAAITQRTHIHASERALLLVMFS